MKRFRDFFNRKREKTEDALRLNVRVVFGGLVFGISFFFHLIPVDSPKFANKVSFLVNSILRTKPDEPLILLVNVIFETELYAQ